MFKKLLLPLAVLPLAWGAKSALTLHADTAPAGDAYLLLLLGLMGMAWVIAARTRR